jgi:hypothetical protein
MPTSWMALAAVLLTAAPEDEAALAASRFTVALPAEVDVIGFVYGVRPELLYRPWGESSRSRLRLAIGALTGPEYFFQPISFGYRAVFRGDRTVQPLVGLGLELQRIIVHDAPVMRRWPVGYVELGSGFALTERFQVGALASAELKLLGEPGPGLSLRAFAAMRL